VTSAARKVASVEIGRTSISLPSATIASDLLLRRYEDLLSASHPACTLERGDFCVRWRRAIAALRP
jgi:hypothetical protein